MRPGHGVWVNHVHEIVSQEAFFNYASASMENFESATYGPVAHQHAGRQPIQLAAVISMESPEKAVTVYDTAGYRAARAVGGMVDGEDHVVKRTICALGA